MRAHSLVVALLIITFTECGGVAPIDPTATPSSSVGASPSQDPPRVVSASGSEAALTITYDRPMKHGLACGTQGFAAGHANTIDGLEMNITSRYYTSPDVDFDEVLGVMWVASLNADCSAVTFTFVHGIAPGAYSLRIAKVQDQAGRPLASDPMTVVATMLETAAPKMQLVQQWEDHALIEFSEPIRKTLAQDVTRYRFDGAPLPAGATVACRISSCATVEITLPTPRARPPNTVTVVGLEDLAGKPFAAGTETRNIDLMQGQ